MTTAPILPPSRYRIVAATTLAALGAGFILVVAILPAEYGLDPLGTGRALGLTALSRPVPVESPQAAEPTPADPSTAPWLAQDEYRIELRPFESVEYKYQLNQAAALVYSWAASAPVEYEFHGEPDGAPKDYFDSYRKGTGDNDQGTFTAAKRGIHGWYFKNHSAARVTVTLRTAGFYTASTEFRDGEKTQRQFAAPAPSRKP